ncbi:hypothetical protein D3C71_78220 [compost metagenome]
MESIANIQAHLEAAGVITDQMREDVELLGSLVENAPEAALFDVDATTVLADPTQELDVGQALMTLDQMQVPEFMRGVSKETPKAMVAMMIWKGLIEEMRLPCLNVFADWKACHSHAYMSEQDGTVEVRPNVRVPRAFRVFVKPLPRRMNKNGTAFTVIPVVEVVGKVPA